MGRRERKSEREAENIKVKSIKLFSFAHQKLLLIRLGRGRMYKTYDFWRGCVCTLRANFLPRLERNGKTKA